METAHSGDSFQHQQLMLCRASCKRGQVCSTADLIAVNRAQALASCGHDEVWRRDLVDAITTSLIKEDIGLAAFVSRRRARSLSRQTTWFPAAGTSLPPLRDENVLNDFDLDPP